MERLDKENNYRRGVSRLRQIEKQISDRIARISVKKLTVCAAVLFVISIIPLLLLGRYNVMCIDDYDYGRQVHDTWLATGSLWQSVQTAWRQNMEFYQNWQGTYLSCFLMALCPMNFWYDVAYVVPILMIGMFATSTLVLGSHILRKWFGCDKADSCLVMLLLLFVFYQVIEAPFEGIYWYNGSTHYVLLESVWFFTLAAVSATFWAQSKKKEVVCCIIATLLAILVGGGNLVTGLQAEIVMALLVLYALVTNRKKLVSACVPFVFGSLGFLFNILAPGNSLREASDADVGFSAVKSIGLSFYHAGVFMIGWTKLLVVLVWLALLPVMWQMVKKSAKKFEHPVWVTLGAYCLLSAMFTPTLYALGMVGLSRVDNIIQMVYYLSLFLVTAYWLGYFSHREKRETDAGETLGSFLEKTRGRMTAVFLLLTLVVWVFTADKNTYTGISAARSLVNGEAQTFYAEAMERYALYTDETVVNVEVQPFTRVPALFDFNDLTEDAGNWLNLAVQEYYHKATVRLATE